MEQRYPQKWGLIFPKIAEILSGQKRKKMMMATVRRKTPSY